MPDSGGTITSIARQKKHSDRVNVHLDGEFGFALSDEVAVSAGLRRGQHLGAEEIADLRERETDRGAYESALNFLSYRPRSVAEVERALRDKGHDEPRIRSIVDRLRRANLVDDLTFARYWLANRNAFSPRGERALRAELRLKGVPDDVVGAVLLEQAAAGESVADAESLPAESARAVEAGRKKAAQLRGVDRQVFRARLGGFLSRRGFDYETLRQAVDVLWDARLGDDRPPDDTGE